MTRILQKAGQKEKGLSFHPKHSKCLTQVISKLQGQFDKKKALRPKEVERCYSRITKRKGLTGKTIGLCPPVGLE